MLPGKSLQPLESCAFSKTKVGPCADSFGSHQRSGNTQPQFFETIIPSSATRNLYQECRLPSSRPPLLWGVGGGRLANKMPQCSYHSAAASFVTTFSLIVTCLNRFQSSANVNSTVFAGLSVALFFSHAFLKTFIMV